MAVKETKGELTVNVFKLSAAKTLSKGGDVIDITGGYSTATLKLITC